MAKSAQEQEEHSSAYQNSMEKRLIRLAGICLFLWLVVLVNPTIFEKQRAFNEADLVWPKFEYCQSFTLSRVGDQTVSIIKKTSSVNKVKDLRNYSQKRWFVQGEGSVTRALDPLLLQRLIEELKQPKLLESRPINNELEAKALALSEVALLVEIKAEDGQTFRFRLGAEHLRHSTWVRRLDQLGQAESQALRLSGRLRRALDHLSHRWPDRRLGLKDKQDDLVKVHCFQGSKQSPKHLRRKAWTLYKGSQDISHSLHSNHKGSSDQSSSDWVLDLQPRPTLHQATIKSFIYTLKTLRVSQFIQAQNLTKPWRPTNTCIWESEKGQTGWLSFGKAQLDSILDSAQGNSSMLGLPLVDLAESQFGIGLIPTHLTHFLVKRSARLLSRKLSFVDPSEIIEVSFIPPPSPLIAPDSIWKSAWQLSKQTTGWRFRNNGHTKFISENEQIHFFEQLSRESAQVSHVAQGLSPALQDLDLKARLRIKLTSSACKRYGLSTCRFELFLIKGDAQTKLFSWYRPHDGLMFMISTDQQKRLTEL